MRITRLDIAGVRRFDAVSLAPGPALNLLTGDNGAGKTSVLEALHLMAYGRSFRGRVRDGLIRDGAPALEVFVEWQESRRPRRARAGLRHTRRWLGRPAGRRRRRRSWANCAPHWRWSASSPAATT